MRVAVAGNRTFTAHVRNLVQRSGHTLVGYVDPLPEVDLIISAHNHEFVGAAQRNRARYGAIGYHPSLLPLHRGRSAVEWTIRDRDRVTGGTVYWLDGTVDGGPIAAQDWCFVRPEWDASDLWREALFPMGLKLIARVLSDLNNGMTIRVPQDEALATFEPAMDPPPLRRPDLLQIGDGREYGESVLTDPEWLHAS